MAGFPPLAQVAGSHINVFESYYKQADPNGTGSIGALDAATFLKKSGLPDNVLSQVWDLADPTGKGYLEKPGFFAALKYVAMAQNNQELNVSKLALEMPAPNVGPVEATPESSFPVPDQAPWAISAKEKGNYDQVFDSLQPVNGLLSGDKVKPVLMNSKLPVDVLGKIWDLGDVDKDGYLDRDEFAVAMHLVYKSLEKAPLPTALPTSLIPPSKRKDPKLKGAVPVLPPLPGGRSTPTPSDVAGVPWVVTPAEKKNFDIMFQKADLDMDGYVSGQEIKDIFLQSGLQTTVLAHIWNLCDTKNMGKLNSEQFALAMYLVQKTIQGVEPPAQLSQEMIPPSLRPKQGADPSTFGVMDGTNAGPYSHVADMSAIKELDGISKDIEEMKRQKLQIERENAQKEADLKICLSETQVLQKEFDAITHTLQQLENQKKEAQKRLDELDDKKSKLEINVKEMREKCEEEQVQINTLNDQIRNQEKSAKSREEDLEKLKVELNQLRSEESRLESNVETGKQQLELLVKSHKDVQLKISQAKTRLQHMEDQKRGLQQGIGLYTAGGLNVDSVSSNANSDDQFSTRATMGSPASTVSNFSVDEFKDDPFKSKDPFGGSESSAQGDPFQGDDPFKGDPFKSDGFSSDPFGSADPFKDSFGSTQQSSKTSGGDPFSGMDPFGSEFSSQSKGEAMDSFDPFGSSSKASQKPDNLFGSDPFAFSSGTASPTPNLPPKQKKTAPPRPAPPKARLTPSPSPKKAVTDSFGGMGSDPFAGSDPFGSASNKTSGSDPFANFADFSPSKFEDDKDAWGTS